MEDLTRSGGSSGRPARPARPARRYFWIAYHDYAGIARGKAVGPDQIADAMAHGVGWAKANWDLAITDHQVPDPAFAADSGDFRLVPDPAATWPLPHRPDVALAFGRLTEPDGTPWDGDPRARLAAEERALGDAGIRVRAAYEAEFTIFSRPSPEAPYAPDDQGRMFTIAELDARWDLLEAILEALEGMGIAVHQIAKEYGPAQYEISLLPSSAVAAADAYLAAREVVKALARDDGLVASFMPKPRADLPGCGLHVHLSLQSSDGTQLLPDLDTSDGLSKLGGAAVAGLLAHAAGQTALGAPTPNSYKRLLPGSWAPAHAAWAVGNRAALVRIPATGSGRHIEYRSGDASANVYLHMAGLLASIRAGIEQGLLLPPPIVGDVGHLSDAAATAAGVPRLPSRLDIALDALEHDTVLGAMLGPTIRPHYLAVKRFEWGSYLEGSGLPPDSIDVSDWERDTYLEPI